jgi:hypothetical protein
MTHMVHWAHAGASVWARLARVCVRFERAGILLLSLGADECRCSHVCRRFCLHVCVCVTHTHTHTLLTRGVTMPEPLGRFVGSF